MIDTTKLPIIRKGQRKPYVKATPKQIEQRIEAASLLIFCGLDKTQIHEIFRKDTELNGVKRTATWLAGACACATRDLTCFCR